MNHRRTLARPYAKAIFELAIEQKALTHWSQLLALLAMIAADSQLQALYCDPRLSYTAQRDIFTGIIKETGKNSLNDEDKNFIELLAQRQRLRVLPEIANLFENYKAALERTLQVTVISAFPIEQKIKEQFKKALEIRLQRAVMLNYLLDKQLLGGAIIRAGDLVIDGSIRSKLDKLRQSLIA